MQCRFAVIYGPPCIGQYSIPDIRQVGVELLNPFGVIQQAVRILSHKVPNNRYNYQICAMLVKSNVLSVKGNRLFEYFKAFV